MKIRTLITVILIGAGAGLLVGPPASAIGIQPMVTGCDVCNDTEAGQNTNCVLHHQLAFKHQMIGTGGSGGWFMTGHTDDRWFCGDCSIHADCPEGGGGDPEEEFEVEDEVRMAVLERGDLEAFGAFVAALPVARVNLDHDLMTLALFESPGRTLAEFPLTPDLVRALE